MYLAIKEMKKEKLRFLMIILVTALIAYLVYFLSSLAYGLAQINKTAINHWNAEGIVISKSSNGNIYGSVIEESDLTELEFDLINAINVRTSTAYIQDESDPYNLVFIGYQLDNTTVVPKIIEGRSIEDLTDVVVSNNIKKDVDIDIGDTIKVSSSDLEFKVVGFTEDSNYNTVPVVYAKRQLVSEAMMMYNTSNDSDEITSPTPNMPNRVSALITYEAIDQSLLNSKELVYIDINDFIKKIPGYQAQVLTFSLMIVSLALISSIIIGIFMYILTMQKKSIFGVLKVQGYRNSYIMKSVVYQSIILTILGFVLGLLATILTVKLLPSQVPVAIFWELYYIITVFAIFCSLIGSLFSARSILKIDPLEAL